MAQRRSQAVAQAATAHLGRGRTARRQDHSPGPQFVLRRSYNKTLWRDAHAAHRRTAEQTAAPRLTIRRQSGHKTLRRRLEEEPPLGAFLKGQAPGAHQMQQPFRRKGPQSRHAENALCITTTVVLRTYGQIAEIGLTAAADGKFAARSGVALQQGHAQASPGGLPRAHKPGGSGPHHQQVRSLRRVRLRV